jgi:hypothetical protein
MRRALLAATALAVLATAACTGDDAAVAPSPSSSSTSQTSSTDSSICGYYFEWKSAWKFALQPDPHAAYSYVIPKVTDDPIGFEITGPFPYAAWTSWTIYNSKAQPFSLATDNAITPDAGSSNPFVVGTPVLSPDRNFTLLVLPKGTDKSAVASRLQDIPSSNVIESPTTGSGFIIANRVYNAFPGYNRGGAGGSTNTPFPTVRAVNFKTGEPVDCASQNLLPSPQPPTEMPTNAIDANPSEAALTLTDGTRIALGPQGSRGSTGTASAAIDGAEFAPTLDPDLIEFTRPPLLPGADVSSIPPPDNCAGYLGAATSTTEVGLIRMPHVAEWFEIDDLSPTTPFEQEETTYISFTQYGSGVSYYDPGTPNTGSLGNAELKVDDSGGSTILVWPPNLSERDKQQVVNVAKQNDWAILRGGQEGKVTTANLFVRLKGSSPSYQGGYTPTDERSGVPCYFDNKPSQGWSELTGTKFIASSANIGSGAPQGVNCSVGEVVNGSCLSRLKSHIKQTGGSYTADD